MFSKLFLLTVLLISAAIAQNQNNDYARLNIDNVRENSNTAFWPRNHGFTPKPFEFESGKTYVYRYSSNVLNGMPKLADQYASLEINGDLVFQCEQTGKVIMQMVNITTENRISKLVHGTEERQQQQQQSTTDRQLELYLGKPVEFTHQKGQVTYMRAEKNEPQWSLNMKRAILSLFNLNLTPEKIIRNEQDHFDSQPIDFEQLTYFGVYEQAVTGVCETSYEVKHGQHGSEHVLNITKNKNLENCLHDSTYFNNHIYDISGCKRFCDNKKVEQITGYYPIPLRNGQIVRCPCTKQRKISSIDQFSNVRYNLTVGGQTPIVESVYGHGRIALKVGGDKISSLTNVNLTLTRIIGEKIINQINGETVEYKGLVMKHEKRGNDLPAMDFIAKPDSRQLLDETVKVFEQLTEKLIADDFNKQLDIPRLTGELQFYMAQFNKESLRILYQKIAEIETNRQSSPVTVRDQIKRQLYLDLLAIVGTNHAAQYITELVRESKVSRHEALNLVGSVANTIYMPERETIDQYFHLCQALKTNKADELALYEVSCLTAGKLVGKGCWYDGESLDSSANIDLVRQKIRDDQLKALKEKRNRIKRENNNNNQRQCNDGDFERWVNWTHDNLVKSTDFHSKVINLQTLLAMKQLKSLPYLVRYVNGKEVNCPGYKVDSRMSKNSECTFLRLIVVNGLKNFAPEYSQHIKALLLPVYFDLTEDYQVRIEALTVLMRTKLAKHELESIATSITRESNKQVISMSISMIKELAQSTHPKTVKMAENARNVLSFMPEFENHSSNSHAHWRINYDNQKDSGIFWASEVISSNRSRFPISYMFSFERFNSERNEKLVSFDVHHQGIENYIRKAIKLEGIITDALRKENQREKRSADQRFDDQLRAVIEMKILDKVRTLTIDEETIKEWIEKISKEITEIMKKLKNGVDHHYVKVLMPTHSFFVLSNDLGMPTLVKRSEPLIISIKVRDGKLLMSNEKKLILPATFNVSAYIEPTIYYTKYDSLLTLTEGNNRKFGVHIPRSTYMRLPGKVSLSYDEIEKIVKFNFVPEMSQVLRHQVKPVIACQPLNSYYKKESLVYEKVLTQLEMPYKTSRNFNDNHLNGMNVQITTESEYQRFDDVYNQTRMSTKEGFVMEFLSKILLDENQYHKVKVELKTQDQLSFDGLKLKYQLMELDESQDQCRDPKEAASETIVKRVRNHMVKAIRERYEQLNDETVLTSKYNEMFINRVIRWFMCYNSNNTRIMKQ